MDRLELEKKNSFVETIIIVILSLHYLTFMGVAIYSEWPSWIPMLMACSMVLLWVITFGQFRSARFRVIIMEIFLIASIVIESLYARNHFFILMPLLTVTITMALYAFTPVIMASAVTVIIVYFMQLFIVGSISMNDPFQLFAATYATIASVIICGILCLWIMKRKKNEQFIRSFISEMQRAQKGKDDFLANVSHEIRTPINTISGLTENSFAETDINRLKEDLMKINQAGKNLMFVVSDILDFSELQKGDIHLEEEEYDISSTINDLIVMASGQRNNQKVELIVNYDAKIPRTLEGDEKRLRRAVMNVINNAFKFTEEGYVVIDISSRDEEYGINLCISVRDTGLGMKPEELENLFSTYNQVDSGRARTVGGIGLGLAISRSIIQKMGGTITVYSTYEEGTEVRMVIPQKVVDSHPIITIRDDKKVHAGVYLNLEHFEGFIRNEYDALITNMRDQLAVQCTMCRNLAELKRRQSELHFTHLFITYREYCEDVEFFDLLSQKMKLIVVTDIDEKNDIFNNRVYQIYKPLHLMAVAQAINGELYNDAIMNTTKKSRQFICPDIKVLVVDDNELNIHVIKKSLKRYQIETDSALSGADALRMITMQEYDFVFMDHMMPEMDGVECLHRIRKMNGRYYKTVPIVALTANAVAGARESLLAEGFDDFLEKPVEASALARMLLRIVKPSKIIELDEEEEAQSQAQPKQIPEVTESSQPVKDSTEEPKAEEQKTLESASRQRLNYGYDDLNKDLAYTYCGGEEAFEEILEIYANKKSDNYRLLQTLYEAQNWKDYVICVHGIKSSMKSIGAEELSEQARLLEMAGRENRIEYIHENHDKVYDMLYALIHDLMRRFDVAEDEEEEQADYPEADETIMHELDEKLEEAAMDLDGDEMEELLTMVEDKSYHGMNLNRLIEQMRQKIEHSDYLSAHEMFHAILK